VADRARPDVDVRGHRHVRGLGRSCDSLSRGADDVTVPHDSRAWLRGLLEGDVRPPVCRDLAELSPNGVGGGCLTIGEVGSQTAVRSVPGGATWRLMVIGCHVATT